MVSLQEGLANTVTYDWDLIDLEPHDKNRILELHKRLLDRLLLVLALGNWEVAPEKSRDP